MAAGCTSRFATVVASAPTTECASLAPCLLLRPLMMSVRLGFSRARTMAQSLRALGNLSDEDIERFLRSYQLFDGDWSNRNGKQEGDIIDYYRVLNHLCSLGNVEKMYIPPAMDPKVGVRANQDLYEEHLCRTLGIGANDRVLDIGCGRGRIACHVAQQSGARVTGLNLDPGQIENAREFVKMNGLGEKAEFVVGSMNDPLPFADNTFDGAYEVQAFSYAPDLLKVMREVFRVLRPGASFSYLDWVLLPGFDPTNAHHADLLHRSRFVLGGVDAPRPEQVIAAMQSVGFEFVREGNPGVERQAGLIKAEGHTFTAVKSVIYGLVAAGVLPEYFALLFARFTRHGDALVECDELELSTTTYEIIARKPPGRLQ